MPTPLAQLPSSEPIPNGRIQIKRGAADTAVNTNNATGNVPISDGAGGIMAIYYTPTAPCFWIVRSNMMAHGYADGTGWRRWDHGIMITPADADGYTTGFQCPEQLYDQTTVEWRTVSGSFCFRLLPGIRYQAYLANLYVSAGTAQYHTGNMWCRIMGRIVGESAV